PFTQKISELVEDLSRTAGEIQHPLLTDNPDAPREAMIIITSNRGLCGGYNGSILRAAMAHLNSHTDRPTNLYVVGKKGIGYIRFLRREITQPLTDITDKA